MEVKKEEGMGLKKPGHLVPGIEEGRGNKAQCTSLIADLETNRSR